jgi:hypothetical protein
MREVEAPHVKIDVCRIKIAVLDLKLTAMGNKSCHRRHRTI